MGKVESPTAATVYTSLYIIWYLLWNWAGFRAQTGSLFVRFEGSHLRQSLQDRFHVSTAEAKGLALKQSIYTLQCRHIIYGIHGVSGIYIESNKTKSVLSSYDQAQDLKRSIWIFIYNMDHFPPLSAQPLMIPKLPGMGSWHGS